MQTEVAGGQETPVLLQTQPRHVPASSSHTQGSGTLLLSTTEQLAAWGVQLSPDLKVSDTLRGTGRAGPASCAGSVTALHQSRQAWAAALPGGVPNQNNHSSCPAELRTPASTFPLITALADNLPRAVRDQRWAVSPGAAVQPAPRDAPNSLARKQRTRIPREEKGDLQSP